jgi:hypothetical protein
VPICEGTLRVERLAIASGSTVELGSFVMPDRRLALSYDDVVIGVTVLPDCSPAVDPANGSFPHRWIGRTLVLASAMLAPMSRAGSCRVRLNNYAGPTSASGVASNDSFVAARLAGAEAAVRFDIPPTTAPARASGAAPGGEPPQRSYVVLLDHIVADAAGRDDLLTIRDGRLAVRVGFPNTRSGEVKVGALIGGRFADGEAPDVDLGPFAVDVVFAVAASADRTRLAILEPSIRVPAIAARLGGRFAELDPIVEAALGSGVRDALVERLSAVFRNADLKRAIEGALGEATAAVNVTVIRSVEGRGDSIAVSYL